MTTPLKWVGLKPYGNLRLISRDVKDATLWPHDAIFAKLRLAGVYKMLWTAGQVDMLKGDYAKSELAFAVNKSELLAGTRETPLD